MKDLIARLEKATGPDRGLDAEIHWLVTGGIGVGMTGTAPAYTGSFDTAMTLLPKGYGAVSASFNEHGPASVRIGHPYTSGNGAMPALALCIAALSALPDTEKE